MTIPALRRLERRGLVTDDGTLAVETARGIDYLSVEGDLAALFSGLRVTITVEVDDHGDKEATPAAGRKGGPRGLRK